MTNKEAIEVFKNPSKHIEVINGQICYSLFFVEAMEMAIKALDQQPLTDTEQRIFLAAMVKEEKVCKSVDECREPLRYEDSLVSVCENVRRKVKKALWE